MLRSVRSSLLAVLAIMGTVPNVRADWGQSPVASAQPQPLPDINLDNYPAVSRVAIARALATVKAHPGDAERIGELGMMLQAWEQNETAAAVYARARAIAPRFEWFYLGGFVEARLAHHREAAQLLADAVRISPSSLPARLALADALFESGDVDGARRQYEPLTSGASEPHARYGLGRSLAASGDANAALGELDTAVRLFPEFGAAWYARGLALRQLGRIEDARDALAKAQQYGTRWPAVEDPVIARVRALRDDAAARSDRAFAFQAQGDTARAAEEYEAALAADPKSVRARVNLIALYCRERQWSKAEHHFQAMVDLGLRVAEGHHNFAICLASQGETARAAGEFRTALEINPQYAPAWVGLAQLAEKEGRLDEAEASYRKAAEQAPDDAATQFNLARMMLARRDSRQAIAVLERIATRDDPNRARVLFALATAHVQAGDIAAGRRYAVEARDLARSRGQADLAAAIERDLARLP
jgi:tetratricopeptide (TPR) repeat protein